MNIKLQNMLSMVAHVHNLSTWEMAVGGPKVILGYMVSL